MGRHVVPAHGPITGQHRDNHHPSPILALLIAWPLFLRGGCQSEAAHIEACKIRLGAMLGVESVHRYTTQ